MKIDQPKKKISALSIFIFLLIWVVFLAGVFIFFFIDYLQ